MNEMTRIIFGINLRVVGPRVERVSFHCDVKVSRLIGHFGNLVMERMSILYHQGCLIRGRSILFVLIGH
jgi:hypothetical protein